MRLFLLQFSSFSLSVLTLPSWPSFLIDELHAHGHTDCASASHISSAMEADPALRKINSSIAECAHATLGRIRKSMSYMNEAHATIYLWTAVQVHNRTRLLRKGMAKSPFARIPR